MENFISIVSLIAVLAISSAYLQGSAVSESLLEIYGRRKLIFGKIVVSVAVLLTVTASVLTVYNGFNNVTIVYDGNLTAQKLIKYQRWLNLADGVTVRVDGTYGNETNQAVVKFQRLYGLAVTGELDRETVISLRAIARHQGVF